MVLHNMDLVPDVVTAELQKVDGVNVIETAENGLVPLDRIWTRSEK